MKGTSCPFFFFLSREDFVEKLVSDFSFFAEVSLFDNVCAMRFYSCLLAGCVRFLYEKRFFFLAVFLAEEEFRVLIPGTVSFCCAR